MILHEKNLHGLFRAGLLRRVERFLDSGEDLALHGEWFAGDACAGGGSVTAPAEFGGDFVYVHVVGLGAKTDASEVWVQFFKQTRNDDWFDGANVVDQSFGVISFG